MKSISTFVLLFTLAFTDSQSQVVGLTQSGDGKSTVPLRGSAIGIDLAKTELSFGINNLTSAVETKQMRLLLGASVRVKNEEGLGNLFSKGDLVPSGNAYGIIGVTFSNAFNQAQLSAGVTRQRLVDRYKEEEKKLRAELAVRFKKMISQAVNQIANMDLRAAVKLDLETELGAITGAEETYADALKDNTNADPSAQLVYRAVENYAAEEAKVFTERKKAQVARLKQLNREFTASSFQRVTLFGFGGISAIGFKQFLKVDSTNLSNSFKDMDERGGEWGLGVNYQWRNLWLGFTWSRVDGNNFSLLKKKEYTVRNTVSLAPQALVEETKITAYSGAFGEVMFTNVNADLVWRFGLDRDYKNYLLLNPYLRASVGASDTKLFPNRTNLGLGLYLLPNESKFLGGIYLELPDINNNVEKGKPVPEQNLRPPLKRMSFGVVTKFSLSTLIG